MMAFSMPFNSAFTWEGGEGGKEGRREGGREEGRHA